MKNIIEKFKTKFLQELKELDETSLYESLDILSDIPEYDSIQNYLSDPNLLKNEKDELLSEFNKAEKECLKKCKYTKLIGEDKSYYCKNNKPYDSNGEMITDYFEDMLEENNLFCEYIGDDIYLMMKKILEKKIQKSYYIDSKK